MDGFINFLKYLHGELEMYINSGGEQSYDITQSTL